MKYIIVFLMLGLSLIFISCDPDDNNDDLDADLCNTLNTPGEITSTKLQGSFTPSQVETYLRMFGAPPALVPDHAVDAHKIVYKTRDKNGDLVTASGVLFVPADLDTLAILSIQHGTEFKRTQVGSVSPLYAFDGLISAMAGYLVFEADYLGLGSSEGIHPYLHAELSANAVIDGIRAARRFACQQGLILHDEIFLAGYSEGGYATMASHREIEQSHTDEFQIAAVAPMAGPYDLVETTSSILNRKEYANPGYMAYVATAYNDIYEWDRLDEIFREPYASLMPTILNGDYTGGEVNDTLSTFIDSLFKPAFKQAFLSGEASDFRNALAENSLLEWGPMASVRLYHGTADSTVYYQNSVTAYQSLKDYGALDIQLVPLLGADHGSGALPAYYFALSWFDSLKSKL